MKRWEGFDRSEEGPVLSLNTPLRSFPNVCVNMNLIVIIPLMFLRLFSPFSLFPGQPWHH